MCNTQVYELARQISSRLPKFNQRSGKIVDAKATSERRPGEGQLLFPTPPNYGYSVVNPRPPVLPKQSIAMRP